MLTKSWAVRPSARAKKKTQEYTPYATHNWNILPQHHHLLTSTFAAAIQSILLDGGVEVKSQVALDHRAKGAGGKLGGVYAGEEGGECRGGLRGGHWLEGEDVR
jgi:hypothetical protein